MQRCGTWGGRWRHAAISHPAVRRADSTRDLARRGSHMAEGVLSGKVGLVLGVANKRSIAWGIAQSWAAAGARLIFNYQGERVRDSVRELVSTMEGDHLLAPCDVGSDEDIRRFFHTVRDHTDRVDMMLHSLAYAPR